MQMKMVKIFLSNLLTTAILKRQINSRETENNDGYVFISNAFNNFQDTDLKLTKIDQNGSVIWESVFGFDIDGENQVYGLDNAYDLILSNDGGYIITGQYHAQHPDALILKIDGQGNLENKYNIQLRSLSKNN